jgi:Mrp family chromosome partitioning ATPase/capsular polysaccharide biosynthesis protein
MTPPGSDYFDLADYVGVLRRRWLMIASFAVIGLVLAGAYYVVAPRIFASTVLIQVNPLPTNANALGGRTGGPVNMDNEGQIATSATVGAIARNKLGSPLTTSALLKKIHVAVPPNTTFLQITCNAGNSALAARCANAFGRAYLYNRRQSALSVITSGLRQLGAEATALETSIERLKTKLAKGGLPGGDTTRGIDELQLSAKESRLDIIQSKISAVTPFEASLTSKGDFVGQVVTPAVQAHKPVSPKKKLLLPSGLAGGLVIGLVLAFAWDWRRPRIRVPNDIMRRVDVATVVSLAEARTATASGFAPPRSPTGQAFTELAQYLGTSLGDGRHVLLVTSASLDSSGEPVAANLAAALARSRGETVLICADPNGAAIPRLLGTSDGRGFAELLAGTAPVTEVTRRTADLPLLRVITPGLDAAGAVYDMQHDKVQRLMRELRTQARFVVIDVPSPSADADTFSLAEFCDGTVIVVRAGATLPADVTDCATRIERMRTKVLAAVLLPATARARKERSRRVEFVDEPPVHRPGGYQGGRLSQPVPAVQPVQAQAQAPAQVVAPSAPVLRPVARRPDVSAGGASATGPASQPAGGTNGSVSVNGGSGGSRHAAPARDAGPAPSAQAPRREAQPLPAQPDLVRPHASAEPPAEPAGPPNLRPVWKPRNVNETWPLPRNLAEPDEETGTSDPLTGN